jgi:hypothetical protein
MKTKMFSILAGIFILNGRCVAQDQKAQESTEKPKAASSESDPDRRKPTADELEAKFKAALTKATLSGRWCSIENGAMGPEKEDKYTIVGVTKGAGDAWIINARIEYNKKDFVAPIPVLVKWAGDTPVLIVDKIPMPGGGVFSARVLFYDRTYAGTWTGGGHGGLLKGVITTEADEKPAAK